MVKGTKSTWRVVSFEATGIYRARSFDDAVAKHLVKYGRDKILEVSCLRPFS